MFGMTRIFPIIHGGQAGILGVGAATARMVPAQNGGAVARHIGELTLTGDHRLLNGVQAATFLAAIRDLILSPLRLLA
jgi:pyruvate/2-oxoglutarate dehydrogenase complex dihydrolipoamide acyltransferase (E2) component